jgi:hypothetical protein
MDFMDLSVPVYAYMLGLFQTDGNLSRGRGNKGKFTLEISIRDKSIIDELVKYIPWYCGVRERTRNTNFKDGARSVTMSICHMDFRIAINEAGVPYGKKSAIVSPPTSECSWPDYYRGVVDGDGSLGVTTNGFPFLAFTTKSPFLADGFMQYCENITGHVRSCNKNKRDDIFSPSWFKEPAQQIVSTLYYPGCLAIRRKLLKAEEVMGWVRPDDMRFAPVRKRWSGEEDSFVMSHSIDESIKALGRTDKSVRVRAWRLRKGEW